jgi:predicted ATPase/DNA-binding XRE family transcriptional regulator
MPRFAASGAATRWYRRDVVPRAHSGAAFAGPALKLSATGAVAVENCDPEQLHSASSPEATIKRVVHFMPLCSHRAGAAGTDSCTPYLHSWPGPPEDESEPAAKLASVMEDGGHDRAPDFGPLLRRYRLAAGLSQESLAERARLSPYGISALERGYRRTPQRETLELLAGALALNDAQRRAFETAAARAVSPRRRDKAAVTVGPWPNAGSADLPLALTRFIGRGDELDEIAALLHEHRLVTITGAGGVGKTQTALRAATVSDESEHGVCFVNLARIGDPSLVATAIAGALGVQEVPNHPLLETLIAFLKDKTMLLLIDNCEHVIAVAATAADSLLRACPSLRILATSREPLKAAGERTYRLPSLGKDDAVALFTDRAQAADVRFSLTDENEPIVGEICRRLSGIPLAIELAAAQVPVLPVSSLGKELRNHFQVLIAGDRTAPTRQQTMHAAIDWSYALLTRPEQHLFERLSIFAGGCTVEAARIVCEGEDVAPDDVLPLISALVSKSLVLADVEGHEPRYRLLEPFRDYAREKLKNHGEEAAVARRHVLAYLELARRFVRREQHHAVYYAHPRDEIGNWRGAVQWALAEGNELLIGQRLVAKVVSLWAGTPDLLGDARRWIPAALDLVNERTPPSVVAELKLAEAHLAMHLDHHTLQLSSAREAIAYYRRVGDEFGLMRSQIDAGNALFDVERNDEARVILEEALSIARKLGNRWDIANVLRHLGACLNPGDLVASRKYLTEAFLLIKAADDQIDLELVAIDFASLAFSEGDSESAVRQIVELFANGRRLYSSRRIAVLAQVSVSGYLITVGRHEEAQKYARAALGAARAEHLDVYAAKALGHLAAIAALGEASRSPDARAKAARILGFTGARLQAVGSAPVDDFDPALAALRETMGASAVARLVAEGTTMTEEEAVDAAAAL